MDDSSTRRIFFSGKRDADLFTLVDEQDFDYLSSFKWYCMGGYAYRNASLKVAKAAIHRVIMRCESGMEVDHINGDPLDNRRCNLRIVTQCQNACNRKLPSTNTSGFKGVSRHKRLKSKPWIAQISLRDEGRSEKLHLGCYATPEEASAAYEAAALAIFGEYRRQ